MDPSRHRAPVVVEARLIRACVEAGQFPPPGAVEVCFAGRSNVGKSSLMNALMGRHNLVRTSATPGCTRRVAFYEVRTKDELFGFVDLPGYGYTRRSKVEQASWIRLIERYLLERVSLRAMLLLVDVRRGVQDQEHELLDLLRRPAPGRPPVACLMVATKMDKLSGSAHKPRLSALRAQVEVPLVGSSTRDPATRGQIWAELRMLLRPGPGHQA
ncbi:MAG: ribosome biogenesis GTP-binding protein YsxC [Polyangiaceae bacterium]|nr:ribosome biogenesis GTP-binding protein YsxC [Polyangiaceae bacterium]